MSRIAVIDARKDLADILNRAAYGKERVILTRRGKDVAAIIPMDDLNALESMEDRADLLESDQVLARVRAGAEPLIPLRDVKAGRRSSAGAAKRAKRKTKK
jgi:prevent-host-death family protein